MVNSQSPTPVVESAKNRTEAAGNDRHLAETQGFQHPISDWGGDCLPLFRGGRLSDGGTLRASRRTNRKIFLKINNLILVLLGNNIQELQISNTILLYILS